MTERVAGAVSTGANRVFCRAFGFGGAGILLSSAIVEAAAADVIWPTSDRRRL
jgi:hypothetical protein